MSWTLEKEIQHEIIIKNSVFRAFATKISSEEEAIAFLRRVEDKDATHNCWAFRVGHVFRSSDDGEPSGTAGRPILSAIEGQDFDGVMVVVTRWFGGVKLGAGGLVRAYSAAAATCLRLAEKKEHIERINIGFHCPFSLYALLEARIASWQIEVVSCEFDAEGALMVLSVPSAVQEEVVDWLRDMTRGQKEITLL